MSDLLRSEIASADPVMDLPDAELHDLVRRMSIDARATATETTRRAPWWKRQRVLIPVGIAGVMALTGAAVFTPLQLSVNDTPVELDVEIPIVYTTTTGVDVKCRFGIYFGDPANRSEADERLADFVEDHNWTGIGQRIYDEAIANPFVPGPDDDWEVDTQLWESGARVPTVEKDARMWCFGIARNVLREHYRHTAKRLALADHLREHLGGSAPVDNAADTASEASMRAEAVRRAVTSLDKRSRELVVLIHWDGFSIADAARLLAMNESTARTRYARALNRLEAQLTQPPRPFHAVVPSAST